MNALRTRSSATRRVILNIVYPLGDVVLLTAAIRDLHACYPGQFLTDVRSYCPDVWRHNPYLTALELTSRGVQEIDCRCPQVKCSNDSPVNSIQGYTRYVGEQLGLEIEPGPFKGDIHLSAREKEQPSPVAELTGSEIPYWIVSAGGKFDTTIKWWNRDRYQAVVDHFAGKIQFVQIGANGHWHPKLRGVIDLRGRTDVRQLIRLVYRAQGVLCPVTSLMHLAAAVETPSGQPPNRPCVVVAGGREPPHWAAYPNHQFIHTVGSLPCCTYGGCWRARTRPLGAGEQWDQEERICVDTIGDLPHCMDMISPRNVIERIEFYFHHRVREFVDPRQAEAGRRAVEISSDNAYDDQTLQLGNAFVAMETFLSDIQEFAAPSQRRGIVLCATNARYLANAWVCIRMLRHFGCELPIEIWMTSSSLGNHGIRETLQDLGVACIDVSEVRKKHPMRRLDGWNVKLYALTHCQFAQALFLDADNVPVSDPSTLFEARDFQETGAVLWRDQYALRLKKNRLERLDIPSRQEIAWDTGQILVDRSRHWRALNLATWLDVNDDFFHGQFSGDHALQLAFWRLGSTYSVPQAEPVGLAGAICHHDFEGNRIFQHRRERKWLIGSPNLRIKGFEEETLCLKFLEEYSAAAEAKKDTLPVSGSTVRSTAPRTSRLWHVYPDLEERDSESIRNKELAGCTWVEQYRKSDWCPFPVKRSALPRTFRDEDRHLVYLSDIMQEASERADGHDVIVLTLADVRAAPSLTDRLRRSFPNLPACYSYCRTIDDLKDDCLTDEEVNAGKMGPHCGLFALSVSWWDQHGASLPDVLLGGEYWDDCLRALIRQNTLNFDQCVDNLTFRERDAASSGLTGSVQRPSHLYNRSLAVPFLRAMNPEPVTTALSLQTP